MKIDILCTDGSPLGVTPKTIWGDAHRIGIGGSELALLTMCELWHKEGKKVTLYNNPWYKVENSFEQRPISEFRPQEDRDILLVFRSPNDMVVGAKGKKVWWSCDQYTIGSFAEFSKKVDEVVCISDFHRDHFRTHYGIQNSNVIDIPARFQDFEREDVQAEKVKGRCIFTSVPDRGLAELSSIWDNLVAEFPFLSLTITADYKLWGADANNQHHKLRFLNKKNVRFLGAIPRNEYLKELNQAEFLIYPCNYDELFCVSVMEAQIAGVHVISTSKGALRTTNMLSIYDGNMPEFLSMVKYEIESDYKDNRIENVILARQRFHPDMILSKWEKVFNA